jgi:hypothetical protein
LRARIVQLAEKYGRYGYRRVTGLLVTCPHVWCHL